MGMLNIPAVNNYTNPQDQYGNMMNWGQPITQEFSPFINQPGSVPELGYNPIPNIPGQDGAMSGNWWDKTGPAGFALGAFGGLASTFLGMKQYGLAKDTLAQNRLQFQKNYDSQKKLTNAHLEDRQRARALASSSAESVDSYMNKNRIA